MIRSNFYQGIANLLVIWITPVMLWGQVQNQANATFDFFNPVGNTQYREAVFLHTDKPYYLTGETLWFKAYCLIEGGNGHSSPLSSVLYLELFDPEGLPVKQVKTSLKNGKGQGQILLGSSLSTGRYLLRAYTAWMRNGSQKHFFQQEIVVINPLTVLPDSTFDDNFSNPEVGRGKSSTQNVIGMATDKEIYSNRQELKLELMFQGKEPGQILNLSVSMYPYHQALESNPINDIVTKGDPQQHDPASGRPGGASFYFPETIGPIIYGKRRNIEEQPGENSIFLSIAGDGTRIYETVEIDLDDFAVQLTPEINYDQLYFWSQNHQPPDILLQPYFDERLPLRNHLPLKFDSATIAFVEKQSVNMQISNLYQEFSRVHGLPALDDKQQVPFYGQPEFHYPLDDYTRFPSLEEVFIEYIRYVTVKRSRGVQLHVWDEYSNMHSLANNVFFDQPALLMLDGVPVNDTEWAMNIDVLKVKSIDVVTKKYFIGRSVFHGIINLITYRGSQSPLGIPESVEQVPYTGLQNHLIFHHPDYRGSVNPNNRIPDRRNTLYWNPEVVLSSEKAKNLRFFTGDSPGEYLIVVKGLTTSGEPIHQTKRIVVTNNSTP